MEIRTAGPQSDQVNHWFKSLRKVCVNQISKLNEWRNLKNKKEIDSVWMKREMIKISYSKRTSCRSRIVSYFTLTVYLQKLKLATSERCSSRVDSQWTMISLEWWQEWTVANVVDMLPLLPWPTSEYSSITRGEYQCFVCSQTSLITCIFLLLFLRAWELASGTWSDFPQDSPEVPVMKTSRSNPQLIKYWLVDKHTSFLISPFFMALLRVSAITGLLLPTVETCSLPHIYHLVLIHRFTFFTPWALFSEITLKIKHLPLKSCLKVYIWGNSN